MQALIKIRNFFTSDAMMFAFLCCFLVIGFGTVNPFTCGNHYFNLFCNAIKIWGFIIIFFSLLDKSKWKLDTRLILLILFVVSYLTSCFVTAQYGGLINNVKGVAWIIIQAILLASMLNKGFFTKWFTRLAIFYIVIASIYAFISLFFLLIGFIYIPSLQGSDTLWMGLCRGRLYGFYKDPNYGAIASSICIYLLLFLVFKKFNWKRIITLCFLSLPQLLYIVFTGSRTALVAVVCSAFVMVIALMIKFLKSKSAKKGKQILIGIGSSVVTCGIIVLLFFGISTLFDKIAPSILACQGGPISDTYQIFPKELANKANKNLGITQYDSENSGSYLIGTDKDPNIYANSTSLVEKTQEPTSPSESNEVSKASNKPIEDTSQIDSSHTGLLARSESSDISNNRFDLWKTAIKIWLKSPVIGVSHYNILNYAKQELPDSKYATMNQITSHNAFLDILAAQGIIGLGIFVAIIVLTLVGFIKLLIAKTGSQAYQIAIMLGLFCLILSSSCFYPELIYINTLDVVFYWYMISLVRSEENSLTLK